MSTHTMSLICCTIRTPRMYGKIKMGLLGNFLKHGVTKQYISDAENLLNIVSSLGYAERAEIRAGAAAAMAFIVKDAESRGDKSFELILAGMYELKQLSQQQIGEISRLNLYLMKAQKQANASSSPINRIISGGIPVWINSHRAVYTVEILPHLRRVWALLNDYDDMRYFDIFDGILNTLGPDHPMSMPMRGARSLQMPPPLFLAR